MNFGWDEANQRAFVNAPVQSPITFTHGGVSERMRIATNGNIGIGTTAPTEKLEVAGNVKVSGLGNGLILDDGTTLTTVAGLRRELNATSPNVVDGYSGNSVIAGVIGATIGGGGKIASTNRVTYNFGTVGGGVKNTAGGSFATVGGGDENTASGNPAATISGGLQNIASSNYSTIGGGRNNTASADHATISGGVQNMANSFETSIGGGRGNIASGGGAAIGGGFTNIASGGWSIVPGGFLNTAAGDYSFAAGRRAKANHSGAFVWGDSTDADFTSTAANQFLIRASGGVGIGTGSPQARLDIQGGANSDGTNDPKAIALSWTGGGFRHWIRTRHNAFGITGNAIDFFTNSSVNAGDSSAPGVGNQLVLSLDGANVGVGTTAAVSKLQVQGGDLYLSSPGQGVILKSFDGITCARLTIDNLGRLVITSMTCP
jgi:hypothetical protein